MTRAAIQYQALEYVKNNWFKIALLVLLLFIFFKKDLTFRINLNNPTPTEEGVQPQQKPVQRKLPVKKRELMTEEVKLAEENTPETNRFDLHGITAGSAAPTEVTELATVDEVVIQEFLKRFSRVAVDERKKYGIPSSIILANALLHSQAGRRDVTLKGNNYFALPCTDNWKGGKGTYQNSCYRHYPSAWLSFRDHSLFLTTGKNSDLLKLGATNYQAWAKALEKRQFSEQDKLAAQLLLLIDRYELDALDAATE